MNIPTAPDRVLNSDRQSEEPPTLNERREASARAEHGPFSNLPNRATTVTPVLSDMLARFEGVARWGLNE